MEQLSESEAEWDRIGQCEHTISEDVLFVLDCRN